MPSRVDQCRGNRELGSASVCLTPESHPDWDVTLRSRVSSRRDVAAGDDTIGDDLKILQLREFWTERPVLALVEKPVIKGQF